VIYISDDYDEYDEFFDKIRKFLKFNTDMIDIDFLFLPESSLDPNQNLRNKDTRGFKVSYHFEPGMDKPEIKIEGDLDKNKLQDYFKNLKPTNFSKIGKLPKSTRKKIIDINNFSLDSPENNEDSNLIEPFTELSVIGDNIEIIMELPGIEKGHVILSLNKDGKTLKVSAESDMRKYLKNIKLPFESSMENYKLEVNNGIATIILKKKL
jgi:HSP20 family molecular chaperone IbpA